MAAPAVVSDQKLEDRIYQLHKLSVDPGMRQILEEASQLCSVGRHMEAAALVEKADAMSSLVSQQEPAPNDAASGPKKETGAEASAAGQPLAARVAADIANGLTTVLVHAIQDLERLITGESNRLSSAFSERLDRLQQSVESLQPLHERLDQLMQAGMAAQERFEQLSSTAASLREAHARLDTDMGVLRMQMAQLSASTTNRVDEACRRIDQQHSEISTINSGISDLASRVAAAAERLERHAHTIRALHDSHQGRAAVLAQVGEFIDRLKSAPASAEDLQL